MDINQNLVDLYQQQKEIKRQLQKINVAICKIQRSVDEDVIIRSKSKVLENDEEFILWFKKRKEKQENQKQKELIKKKLKSGTPLCKSEYSINSTYVYSLYHNNQIVYVGITKNLDNRIRSHKKTKVFDRYEILNIFSDRFYALREENTLIKLHNPKYNKQTF